MAQKEAARGPMAGIGMVEVLPPLPMGVEALAEAGELGVGHLAAVDKAMFLKACEGSVQAARLVYLRVLGAGLKVPDAADAPTLEELEAQLDALKRDGTP